MLDTMQENSGYETLKRSKEDGRT